MKVLLVVNTGRRRKPVPARILEGFAGAFGEAGVEWSFAESGAVEHAPDLVAGARASGCDTLLVGGGDGTLNVMLNAAWGSGLTLGVVPMGTVNAFARSVRIPLDPVRAVRHLLAANPAGVDAGRMNDRHFLCFASVGFDAGVVHDVNSAAKKQMGRLAFAVCGVKALGSFATLPRFTMEPEGRDPAAGHSLVLANIRNYAGATMFPDAAPDSGTMEAVVFLRNGALPIARWIGHRLAGLPGPSPDAVAGFAVRRFTLEAQAPLRVQLDGEPVHLGDDRRLEFECLPGAVRMLL